MRSRPFQQVDVFTATPYLGNPVAVVLDGSDLDDDRMSAFARWTNLSETTFVLPPGDASADYRLRIFTPGGELAFAGHPTLGSCHAWLQAAGAPRTPGMVVQQCGVGLVNIRRDGDRLAFAGPALTRTDPDTALLERVAHALGLKAGQMIAAQLLDNGTIWLGLLLDSPGTLLRLTPDFAALKSLGHKVGVAAVAPDGKPGAMARGVVAPALQVRGFAPHLGVNEDPVTGSLNASLAQWLIADALMPPEYVAAQGECLGRAGRVFVQRDARGQVWVGGRSVTCVDGSVAL